MSIRATSSAALTTRPVASRTSRHSTKDINIYNGPAMPNLTKLTCSVLLFFRLLVQSSTEFTPHSPHSPTSPPLFAIIMGNSANTQTHWGRPPTYRFSLQGIHQPKNHCMVFFVSFRA